MENNNILEKDKETLQKQIETREAEFLATITELSAKKTAFNELEEEMESKESLIKDLNNKIKIQQDAT